ncbi:MAG TPA: hypothetical protein VGK73_20800 [Polyangiaceae bacterium]
MPTSHDAPARNPVWIELVQLVPVVTLALPFIAQGSVDLARAQSGLVAGALLTIPVTALVVARKGVLNPILLGTALWLWVSALAFLVPIHALLAPISEAQAFGLFVGVTLVGVASTLFSPRGFIGCRHPDRRFVTKASLALLALALAALVWAWIFRRNVRIGGGLPFIVLNVARRAIVLRAPGTPSRADT